MEEQSSNGAAHQEFWAKKLIIMIVVNIYVSMYLDLNLDHLDKMVGLTNHTHKRRAH